MSRAGGGQPSWQPPDTKSCSAWRVTFRPPRQTTNFLPLPLPRLMTDAAEDVTAESCCQGGTRGCGGGGVDTWRETESIKTNRKQESAGGQAGLCVFVCAWVCVCYLLWGPIRVSEQQTFCRLLTFCLRDVLGSISIIIETPYHPVFFFIFIQARFWKSWDTKTVTEKPESSINIWRGTSQWRCTWCTWLLGVHHYLYLFGQIHPFPNKRFHTVSFWVWVSCFSLSRLIERYWKKRDQ